MTAIPIDRSKAARTSLDIPKIKFFSWLGLESIVWSVVAAHIVKWAVSFAYFAAFQVKYLVGYGTTIFTVWYLKDWWDRLPVHISNVLGYHWADQAAPAWWVVWRHDIRDVGIALIATIIVDLMFTRPKYPVDDNPGWKVYLTAFPLGLLAALVPIALIGVLAWKLPWLLQHGWHVPDSYGAWAAEVNGWVAAGTWITVAMGIAGGLAAKRFIKRPADDIQWFFAERSAAKIRSDEGLNKLRTRVIGTPAHRKRVHWLLDHPGIVLPHRSPWLVRILLVVGFITLAFAGAGAWLNLVGPAAPH